MTPAARPGARKAVGLAALLVLVDAFVFNQGVIAFLVGVWLVLVSVPVAFFAKRWAGMRMLRMRYLAILMAGVFAVFIANGLNNRLARNRAEAVIAAVQAYRDQEKRYPKSLEELVPRYLPEVPLAKYTLTLNKFRYYAGPEDDARLSFVALPPFGRPIYRFKSRSWGYLD